MINIQGKEYAYEDSAVLDFSEGLIGFPAMRRAVIVPFAEFEPFCWLASLDDEKVRFVVVNPERIFDNFQPNIETAGADLKTLAIVKVSSDWQKTTFNLRAPIFVNAETRRAAQIVLDKSVYSNAEALPNN